MDDDVHMSGDEAVDATNVTELKQDELSDNEVDQVLPDASDFPPPLPNVAKGKIKAMEHASDLDNLRWWRSLMIVANCMISMGGKVDKFISLDRLPHLLFYGPPGTGKTSTILAIARKIYSTSSAMRNNVLELNASDDRGIEVVREQIKNFAGTRMVFASTHGYKMIILDEADMMTTAAQGALRRVIEQYTTNARFCIICNYVNRIIPAIQSRCTKFRFGPLPEIEIEKRLNHVVDAENVNLTLDGRKALMKLSKGDMRRALNVLQACHSAYPVTDEAAVYNCTGNPHPSDIEEIVSSMMNEDFETSFRRITAIKTDKGLALQDIISGIYDHVRTIDFPSQSRIYLLDHLAQVEHRLSTGGNEKLQLTSLLGTFKGSVQLASHGEPSKLV